jgi:hypothetical protein
VRCFAPRSSSALGPLHFIFVIPRIEVGERLPVGVPDDVAAGHRVGVPGRREAAEGSAIAFEAHFAKLTLSPVEAPCGSESINPTHNHMLSSSRFDSGPQGADMAALRRMARRKTADLSAVIPTTIALGIALAIVQLSVHAETKVRGTAAPQTTPTAAADDAKRPVPVPGSGGPTPPIRAAHRPAPVLIPPPPGTTAPIPVPEIGPGPAPAPMPLQPAAVRIPAPLLPTASPAAAPPNPRGSLNSSERARKRLHCPAFVKCKASFVLRLAATDPLFFEQNSKTEQSGFASASNLTRAKPPKPSAPN